MIPENSAHAWSQVKVLRESPGWLLFVAEYEARFKALTTTVLDVKTASVEAENLRQARGRIEQDFDPSVMLDNLLTKLHAHATAQMKDVGVDANLPQ